VAMVNGHQLSCREHGAGPAVLLVHGTAAAVWGDLPERLSGFRVIDYDRRGFGASAGEPGASLSQHADDAAGLLVALAASPAVVVGWSIGGIIALELAVKRPELVAALVVVDSPLHAKRHPRPRMVAAIGAATVLSRLGRHESGGRRFLRWACGDGFERLPPGARDPMLANGRAIVAELAHGTGEHLDREQLAAIDRPVIWLGAADSDAAFRSAARRAAREIPVVELREVDRSGHVMQYDRPDAIADAVRALA
jgi:3-oxoadipate enol-lactonase